MSRAHFDSYDVGYSAFLDLPGGMYADGIVTAHDAETITLAPRGADLGVADGGQTFKLANVLGIMAIRPSTPSDPPPLTAAEILPSLYGGTAEPAPISAEQQRLIDSAIANAGRAFDEDDEDF